MIKMEPTELFITNLSYVPVDVPLPHVVITPGLDYVSHAQVDTNQAIVCNAQDFVFTATFKSGKKIF